MNWIDLWFIFWGILAAFCLQVIYDGIGEYPNVTRKFWFGLLLVEAFLIILVIMANLLGIYGSLTAITLVALVASVIATIFFMLTKQKREKPSKQIQNKHGTHSDLDKIAVVLSIISLFVSGGLTAYSFSLTNQANDLTKQANTIAERSLDLQNMQSNYTFKIITNPNLITTLDGDGHFQNETNNPTTCYGWLNDSLTVISPYYGTLSIHILNFTVSDDYSFLLPDKANLTKVTPFYGYSQKYESLPVVSGLNPTFSFSFLLGSDLFPNPQKLPTLANSSTVAPIGFLLLEAKIDCLTGLTFTENFDAQIFVVIRNNY